MSYDRLKSYLRRPGRSLGGKIYFESSSPLHRPVVSNGESPAAVNNMGDSTFSPAPSGCNAGRGNNLPSNSATAVGTGASKVEAAVSKLPDADAPSAPGTLGSAARAASGLTSQREVSHHARHIS